MYKKFIIAVAVFSLLSVRVSAQDVIVTRDSKKIESQVLEVNEETIRYKKYSNPDGPDYVHPKDDILTILYENGRVEVFKTENASVPDPVNDAVNDPVNDPEPIAVKSEEYMLGNDCALLHIYRNRDFKGSMISYDVRLDNEVVHYAKNNSKTTVKITKEGRSILFARTESKVEIPIDIQFGHEYYIRCGIRFGVFVGRPKLEIVDKQTGKMEFDIIQ